MATHADPRPQASKLTCEDYVTLPNDGRRYEILVEILSDSTERHDRGAKMKLDAQYGVNRFWIIDAGARALEIYALRDSKYAQLGTYRGSDRVVCDIPAGLELRLAEIWPA